MSFHVQCAAVLLLFVTAFVFFVDSFGIKVIVDEDFKPCKEHGEAAMFAVFDWSDAEFSHGKHDELRINGKMKYAADYKKNEAIKVSKTNKTYMIL